MGYVYLMKTFAYRVCVTRVQRAISLLGINRTTVLHLLDAWISRDIAPERWRFVDLARQWRDPGDNLPSFPLPHTVTQKHSAKWIFRTRTLVALGYDSVFFLIFLPLYLHVFLKVFEIKMNIELKLGIVCQLINTAKKVTQIKKPTNK